MIQEPVESTPTVSVHTSAQSQRMPPPWLSEAVLILQLARDSALLSQMQRSVRVPRGRMGTFEVCDFFLVLLVYAVSGELTLLALYAAMKPSVALLGALWSRKHLPARSTLSRFLAAMTPPATEALRALLFEDLLAHGLSGERVGGLVDRGGARHVVFDVDGTRQVARQRSVISDDQHPPVRRRLDKLCAPGYPGRKRGEVVRTRSTVQQAHTREWLGTFGAAGNGDAFGELTLACKGVARYLTARGLCPQQGIVRLDGLYGYVRGAYLVQQQGLGYLMRVADYRLLKDERVQQALARPPLGQFVQPDTGTVREVFEGGALNWVSADSQMQVCCRLIVTRREVDKKRPHRVGKCQGDFVLELFASDRDAQGLSAMDLLSLYFARGGFEQTLAEEDQEQDPDQWCSGHPVGQESWQLLSQWIWNVRLRLGTAAVAPPVRHTLWAEAQTPTEAASPCGHDEAPAPAADPPLQSPPVFPEAPETSQPRPEAPAPTESAPSCPAPTLEPPRCPGPAATASEAVSCPPPSHPPGQVAPATGRGSGRFAGADFVWTESLQLRCPAGKLLRPLERTLVGRRQRIRFQARVTDCAACPLVAACRGTDAAAKQGRRVTVWTTVSATGESPLCHLPSPSAPVCALPSRRLLPAPPSSKSLPLATTRSESAPAHRIPPPLAPPLGSQALWWEDVPATALRRFARREVYCQCTEVPPAPPSLAESVPLTRAGRAHRRLSWQQRLMRNAYPPQTQPWEIKLYGVSAGITAYLASISHSAG